MKLLVSISLCIRLAAFSLTAVQPTLSLVLTDRMKESHQQWSGRIVVRFLDNDVESDYEIRNKPKAARIEFSMISGRSTPLHGYNGQIPYTGSDNDEPGNPMHIPCSSEPCTIRLDAFLVSKTTNQSISITLIRDGTEEASRCLKRLELSLAKKLFKKQAKGKKQKVAQNTASPCIVSVKSKDGAELVTEIKPEAMSNHQFWTLCAESSMELQLKLGGVVSTLPIECNPPTISRVTSFENFSCDIFPQVPLVVRVDTLFSKRAIVDWYADDERVCRDSPCYVPTLKDVGKILVVVITPVRPGHTSQQCSEAYRYEQKVGSDLPPNTTLNIRSEWLAQQTGSDNLRVMSYNILADQNAWNGEQVPFFPYVSKELLAKSRRFPLILQEILAHKAEIVCLQEVDRGVFMSLLQPVLEFYNYQGFHSLKQSEGNNEGCAIFWSLHRFEKVDSNVMKTFRISELLKDCLEENPEMDSSWKQCSSPISELFAKRKDLEDILLSKLGHILQIVRLKDREGKAMIVANTHLYFQNLGSHIRALQLFAVAHQLSVERGAAEHPFLLIGDLNSSLGNAATLILKKNIPMNYRNYKESLNTFSWDGKHGYSGHDNDFPPLSIPESFPTLLNGYSESPWTTHFIRGFNATIDHIFLSEQSRSSCLRPLRHGPIPSFQDVTSNEAMPSPNFPSDHLSLVCDLEWSRR